MRPAARRRSRSRARAPRTACAHRLRPALELSTEPPEGVAAEGAAGLAWRRPRWRRARPRRPRWSPPARGTPGTSSGSGRRPSAPSARGRGSGSVSAAPPSRPAARPAAAVASAPRDHLRAQRPRGHADRLELGLLSRHGRAPAPATARPRGGERDERAEARPGCAAPPITPRASGSRSAAARDRRRAAARGRRGLEAVADPPALGDRRQARGLRVQRGVQAADVGDRRLARGRGRHVADAADDPQPDLAAAGHAREQVPALDRARPAPGVARTGIGSRAAGCCGRTAR